MKKSVGAQKLADIICNELSRLSGKRHIPPLIEILAGETPNWRTSPFPPKWAQEAIRRLQDEYQIDETAT